MFQPVNNLNGLTIPIVSIWPFQRFPFWPLPLLNLFTVHSPSPRPYPLPLDATCRRSSHQHHRHLFPLTILSTHQPFQLVPRPLLAKRRSLELTLKESSTPTSGRRGIQSGGLPPSTPPGPSGNEASYFHSTSPSYPKLHSRLCNCRSLKAPARPSSSGTSPTIHKRIARHYRGTAQSGATLQGPPARKRYRIFLPSKVQKPQSNQAPLTHTNI